MRPRCGRGRRAPPPSPAPPRVRATRGLDGGDRRPAAAGTGSETSSRWPPTISVSPSRSRRGRSSGSPFSAVPLRLSRSVAISTPPRFSISRWFQETASSSMRMSASGSRPITVRSAESATRARLAVPRPTEPDSRVHPRASHRRPRRGECARERREKRLAAEAAAELVEDGMTVGLGTGSTVAHLLPAIARARPQRDPLRRHLGRDRGAGARAGHPGRGVRRAASASTSRSTAPTR